MKVVNPRFTTLLAAVTIAAIAACSDSGTTQPLLSPDALQTGSGGKTGDSSTTGNPGQSNNPGSPGDTATRTPGDSSGQSSKPVATFTLDVKMVAGTLSGVDSLSNGPVAGVRVDVYSQTYTFTGGGGADTAQINQTLVTTGVTDATGHIVFSNLKGQEYALKVTPPDGSGYRPFTGFVPTPYSDKIAMTFWLQKQ